MNANISEMLTIGLCSFFFFFLESVLFCFGRHGQVGTVMALVRLAYHMEQKHECAVLLMVGRPILSNSWLAAPEHNPNIL